MVILENERRYVTCGLNLNLDIHGSDLEKIPYNPMKGK